MVKDELGTRMKKYEYITRTHLVPRMPVIIRLDGRAFHTFTKGLKKPFDELLVTTMQQTMKELCKNIQGCVLGYTQSDEITLVLVDYKELNSSSWFDNNIQKICSVSASMATSYFNLFWCELTAEYMSDYSTKYGCEDEEVSKYFERLNNNLFNATFDSRVFNIPKEEVTNCIYWRQLDAIKNSIASLSQAHFSHKELHNKGREQMKSMLSTVGIYWDDLPTYLQRGSCCIKMPNTKVLPNGETIECMDWAVDYNIPIFKDHDRDYIDNLIMI